MTQYSKVRTHDKKLNREEPPTHFNWGIGRCQLEVVITHYLLNGQNNITLWIEAQYMKPYSIQVQNSYLCMSY